MRVLEILILIAVVPAMGVGRRSRWLRAFAVAALGLLLLHLGIEGYRWQMVPAYLLVVWSCARGISSRDGAGAEPVWGRFIRLIAALAACALTIVLAEGSPVFEAPPPSGSYLVGTSCLELVDASREDSFAPTTHAPRELLVAAWYPAEPIPGAQPEAFWPDARVTGPEMARLFHLPRFNLLGQLRLVKSHAYTGAAVARAKPRYLVLIFSHGYGGTPWQNTVQMEELASHGFIIFSVGHTYESMAIGFPDSRVAPMNRAGMEAAMKDRSNGTVVRERLGVWVADTRFVIDAITEMDAGARPPGKIFTGRLDLKRLGVFGMSFGGAAAGEFCASDARCRAGMNIDGFQSGSVRERPLSAPFLYFAHEGNTENDPIYAASRGDLYGIQVRHSTYINFSDANLVLPILKWADILGSIDAREMERILNAYTVEFFEKYLEGKPARLLDGRVDQYPEVEFRARRAAPVKGDWVKPRN